MSVNILVETRVQPKIILDKENPVLGSGEIAIDKELTVAKMGDGITHWEQLSELTVDKETLEKWYNIATGVTNSRLITLPDLNFAYTTVNVDSNPLIKDIVDAIVKGENYFSLLEGKQGSEGSNVGVNDHNTLTFEGTDFFDITFLTTSLDQRISHISRLGFTSGFQKETRYYLLQDDGARDQIGSLSGNLTDISDNIDEIKTKLKDEVEPFLVPYPEAPGITGLVPAPASGESIQDDSRFLHIGGRWRSIFPISAENVLLYKEVEGITSSDSVANILKELQARELSISFYNVSGLPNAQKPEVICITGIKKDDNDPEGMYYHPNIYINGKTGVLFGAAYNDYAEARETKPIAPGRVVVENGDDTLSMATERLMLGGNIVSDTYGMLIGETDKAKTPIALCGRVLAYPNEDRSEYYAGAPVCTGPNGTVSIMTKDEVLHYPECVIGYVSAVPTYEEWNGKKVNGRIWIKVI